MEEHLVSFLNASGEAALNRVRDDARAIAPGRPQDFHDVLGVFNQALRAGSRDSGSPPDAAFVAGLQERHRARLERRPEANPGELETDANFAGSTQFVLPAFQHRVHELAHAEKPRP